MEGTQGQKETRQLAALAKVLQALHRSRDLEEVLQIALDEALQVSGLGAGGIYLLDEERGELHLLVQRGGVAEVAEQLRVHKLGHGLTGRAAAECRAIVSPDVAKEFPQFQVLVERCGLRSQISLPLAIGGRLLGVLNFNKPEVYEPSTEEMQFLTMLADYIAQAIASAKLYEEERARARREAALAAIGKVLSRTLEIEELLDGLLGELLPTLGLDLGGVYLIEDEEFVLKAYRGLSPEFVREAERNPLDHPILGRALRAEGPFEVSAFPSLETKKEGTKYAVYVPLLAKERPLGVLIGGDRSGQRLKPEELKLLQAVGAQLSLALEQVEAVRESRYWRRFNEELLENAPVGLLRLDREGRILYENPAMREILGVPEGKLPTVRMRITEIPNIIEAGLVAPLEALLAGEGFENREVVYTSIYGKRVIVSAAGIPLFDKAGEPEGAMLLVRDITMVRDAERLRRSLLEVAQEVLASRDVGQILQRMAQAITDHSPFQRAALSLYDLRHDPPLEGALVQTVAAGLTAEEERQLHESGGLTPAQRGQAFREQFRISNSYYIPHDRLPWGPELGVRGRVSLDGWHPDDFLFIPLRSERGIIGHISVDDPRTPRAVDTRALEPLEVFAGLAALAVERAARLEELQRHKDWLRSCYQIGQKLIRYRTVKELLSGTLEILKEELRYDYGAVLLRQGEELVVEAVENVLADPKIDLGYRLPLGRGITNWVADHRQATLVNDVSQDPRYVAGHAEIRSELAVPIQLGDELLGVLNMESATLNRFRMEDQEFLSSVAAQLAVALQELRERQALENLAIRDSLTGLYNRHYFNEIVERELERSKRYGHHLVFFMLDLDDFRRVNNTYGHLKGDEVLRQIADLLMKNVRAADLVFRYGGDEFLILLPEMDGEGEKVIARLHQAIADWNKQSGLEVRLGFSIGASSWSPGEGRRIEEVLEEADRRLYKDKLGRG